MEKHYQVTGMTCDGCVRTVTEKLSAVPGVQSVQVNLEKGQAKVTGRPLTFLLKRALKDTLGYFGSLTSSQKRFQFKLGLFFMVANKDSDVSRCVPSKIKTPLWKQITFARRCRGTMR